MNKIMSTLRQLSEEYAYLLDVITDFAEQDEENVEFSTDELQEYINRIEILNENFDQKVENYYTIIEQLKEYNQVIKQEISRLNERKKRFEKSIEYLTGNLIENMKLVGKTKVQTPLHTFSVSKSGGMKPLVVDVDVEYLPDELTKVVKSADNKAIREYIEATGDVSYAHFEERKDTLRVK